MAKLVKKIGCDYYRGEERDESITHVLRRADKIIEDMQNDKH